MLAASVHADTVQTVSCRSLGTECPVTELHAKLLHRISTMHSGLWSADTARWYEQQ